MSETMEMLNRLYDFVSCNKGEFETADPEEIGETQDNINGSIRALDWVLSLIDDFIWEQEACEQMEKGESHG